MSHPSLAEIYNVARIMGHMPYQEAKLYSDVVVVLSEEEWNQAVEHVRKGVKKTSMPSANLNSMRIDRDGRLIVINYDGTEMPTNTWVAQAQPDYREALAAYAHAAWAGWMNYLFRFGTQNEDGTFTIDADKVERWRRQATTTYTDLSEAEKDSDRKEADEILRLMRPAIVVVGFTE